MASLHWTDGRAEIRLRKPNTEKQTTIRLGESTDDYAREVLKNVKRLETAARQHQRDEIAIRWAKTRPDWL